MNARTIEWRKENKALFKALGNDYAEKQIDLLYDHVFQIVFDKRSYLDYPKEMLTQFMPMVEICQKELHYSKSSAILYMIENVSRSGRVLGDFTLKPAIELVLYRIRKVVEGLSSLACEDYGHNEVNVFGESLCKVATGSE